MPLIRDERVQRVRNATRVKFRDTRNRRRSRHRKARGRCDLQRRSLLLLLRGSAVVVALLARGGVVAPGLVADLVGLPEVAREVVALGLRGWWQLARALLHSLRDINQGCFFLVVYLGFSRASRAMYLVYYEHYSRRQVGWGMRTVPALDCVGGGSLRVRSCTACAPTPAKSRGTRSSHDKTTHRQIQYQG